MHKTSILVSLIFKFFNSTTLLIIGTLKTQYKHVAKVVYRLALLASIDWIHNVFHVLLLCKYTIDPILVLIVDDVEFEGNLANKECLVQILDRQVK